METQEQITSVFGKVLQFQLAICLKDKNNKMLVVNENLEINS